MLRSRCLTKRLAVNEVGMKNETRIKQGPAYSGVAYGPVPGSWFYNDGHGICRGIAFSAVDGIGMDSVRRRPLWHRHAKRHPDGAPGARLHLGNLGYAIIDIAEDS